MDQVCRVCRASTVPLVDIFVKRELLETKLSLADMLSNRINSKSDLEDTLPKKICQPCILDVQSAYILKLNCEENEDFFDKLNAEEWQIMRDIVKIEQVEIADLDSSIENVPCSSPQNENKNELSNSLECKTCGEVFVTNQQLTVHSRTHKGERPYKCSHCQKEFTRYQNLERHNLIHNGERPYKCSYCSKAFFRNDHLKKHTRTHKDMVQS